MKTDNCCSVSDLSEYISAIEKYNLFNCTSRGENKKYLTPLQSGIRRNNIHNYSHLLDEYYHDVETTINLAQEKNFLAFAQHHGIPTNLLDLSFSPLVSLYFSVDDCTDKGYVYFINKSKTVSISKILLKKDLGWGLFEDLLNNDSELYKCIISQLSDAFYTNRIETINYFEKHAHDFIEYFRKHRVKSYLDSLQGGVDDFEKSLIKYKADKPKWEADESIKDELTLQIFDSVPNFLGSMQNIYKGETKYHKENIR